MPNDLNPGVWQTLRGPFQLPSSDYNQAMAELDAREANPRSGIPDDQFAQLTLERALAEQLSPFNVGMALGAKAVAPVATGRNFQYLGLDKPPQSRNVGGSLLERNPVTGQWDVKFAKAPEMDKETAAKIKDLQGRIAREHAALIKSTDENEIRNLVMSIQGMEKMRAELFGQGEESSSLPSSRWQVDPNSLPVGEVSMPEQADQLSMFGKMGARTPFMFSGAAMAPEPMAPRRVGRFNVYRGGQ